MKRFIIFQWCAVLFFNYSFAQKDFSFPISHKVFEIEPSKTDARITEANTPHLIAYDTTIKQGKLLLFMPGTNGIALRGPKKLFLTAIEQGYRVINISYINTPAVARICKDENLEADAKCTDAFRTRRIFGTNEFPLIADQPYDAIENRLVKLLQYLSKIDKDANWNMYLNGDHPNWEEIALAGQSQGGGMAAFIAKDHLVARVIDFSGGWDYSAKNKIATWYAKKSTTPLDRWYGTYHAQEPMAKTIRETYLAMKIPERHIYAFDLDFPEGKKAHSNAIRNINYKKEWIDLLGRGN
ncbi:hypothetical protein KO500_03190 [Cellulophaga baltica]|uniref:BPSS1187 family protein n=1 Tax=Cellulophaga TaxID=104264 RepID=UPI001C0708D3|nr:MULTISPECIES: hypothetical protein [Cellulophaga]MBU2995417.1 hypothetical protein [Cellulophaga baltica]MDO6766811.1 hypothetical protein [Cellulophaga sp. 1_MG-2023]